MMLLSKEGVLLEHSGNSGELRLYRVDGRNLELYYKAILLNNGKSILPLVEPYFNGPIEEIRAGLEGLVKVCAGAKPDILVQ